MATDASRKTIKCLVVTLKNDSLSDFINTLSTTPTYDCTVWSGDIDYGIQAIGETLFSIIFLDLSHDPKTDSALSLVEEFQTQAPGVPIVALLENGSQNNNKYFKESLVERGVNDYLKPQEASTALIDHLIRYCENTSKSQATIQKKLNFDQLTGLSNKNLCHDRITQAMLRTERSGQFVALLFIDLDNFTGLNENFGYEAGNTIMRAASDRLVSSLRREDSVSRYRSDEFVVVLEGLKDPEHTSVVAKQIIKRFAEPVFANAQPVFVTPSIGCSVSSTGNVDGAALLKQAEIACHDCKDQGGNTFYYFNPYLNEIADIRASSDRTVRESLEKLYKNNGTLPL